MNVAAPLVDLWGSVENDIIADIARRLIKNGENTPTAAWQMMKLREMGVLQTDMSKALSKATKRNEKDLYRMIVQACKDALAFDDEMYVKAGYAPIPMTESAALMSVIQSGIRKTSGLMSNFTNTLAADGNKAFAYALDRAWLQVSTGAFTQQQALTMVVEDLSKKGIRGIVYPSGHKDKLDVAARRALITGMNQTVAELQLARMDEMNCDLVEVTSHAGARPTHAVWQGQVYSRRGRTSEYGNFYDETGYGTGEGLCGWNCYHSFYPYFEGLSRRAAERDPAARLGKSNDQVYEESQQQRYFERQIREAKRECVTLDAARGAAKDPLMKQQLDAEFSRASVKLKSREAKLDAFCKETGRTKLSDRASVVGFGRSTSSKATWAAKKADNSATAMLKSGIERGIINTGERKMALGYRQSQFRILTETEIQSLYNDIRAIKADERVFRFNEGYATGYIDEVDIIRVRGDVLPDLNSKNPRDLMSARAVLAHEYYGHRAFRGTSVQKGSWNDEFRASYTAALKSPGLTDTDRSLLMQDALERAREAKVSIRMNEKMKRWIYGLQDHL